MTLPIASFSSSSVKQDEPRGVRGEDGIARQDQPFSCPPSLGGLTPFQLPHEHAMAAPYPPGCLVLYVRDEFVTSGIVDSVLFDATSRSFHYQVGTEVAPESKLQYAPGCSVWAYLMNPDGPAWKPCIVMSSYQTPADTAPLFSLREVASNFGTVQHGIPMNCIRYRQENSKVPHELPTSPSCGWGINECPDSPSSHDHVHQTKTASDSDQEQPSQETAVLPRVLVVASPPADGIKYSAEILIPGNWYDPTALVEEFLGSGRLILVDRYPCTIHATRLPQSHTLVLTLEMSGVNKLDIACDYVNKLLYTYSQTVDNGDLDLFLEKSWTKSWNGQDAVVKRSLASVQDATGATDPQAKKAKAAPVQQQPLSSSPTAAPASSMPFLPEDSQFTEQQDGEIRCDARLRSCNMHFPNANTVSPGHSPDYLGAAPTTSNDTLRANESLSLPSKSGTQLVDSRSDNKSHPNTIDARSELPSDCMSVVSNLPDDTLRPSTNTTPSVLIPNCETNLVGAGSSPPTKMTHPNNNTAASGSPSESNSGEVKTTKFKVPETVFTVEQVKDCYQRRASELSEGMCKVRFCEGRYNYEENRRTRMYFELTGTDEEREATIDLLEGFLVNHLDKERRGAALYALARCNQHREKVGKVVRQFIHYSAKNEKRWMYCRKLPGNCRDYISLLIGTGGQYIKRLEEQTKCRIYVHSRTEDKNYVIYGESAEIVEDCTRVMERELKDACEEHQRRGW